MLSPRPAKRTHPKWICYVDSYDAEHLKEFSLQPGARCESQAHRHYKRNKLMRMIDAGMVIWVGDQQKVATPNPKYGGPVEWHKVKGIAGEGNSYVAAMQMLSGGEQRFPRFLVGGLVSPK